MSSKTPEENDFAINRWLESGDDPWNGQKLSYPRLPALENSDEQNDDRCGNLDTNRNEEEELEQHDEQE